MSISGVSSAASAAAAAQLAQGGGGAAPLQQRGDDPNSTGVKRSTIDKVTPPPTPATSSRGGVDKVA